MTRHVGTFIDILAAHPTRLFVMNPINTINP